MSAAKSSTATADPTEITPLPIWEAIIRAKASVGPVGKDGWNPQQKFKFRGVDAVVNALAGALDRYGIIPVPKAGSPATSIVETKNGGTMQHVILPVTFQFTDINGDHADAEVIGEAFDAGDKGLSKAQSVAFRIALLQVFNLPTGDPDPDESGYERERGGRNGGETFENARPAPPRNGQQGNGNGNGQRGGNGNGAQRPANGHANGNGNGQQAPQRPQRQRMQPQPPLDPEDAWRLKVDELTTPDDARRAWEEVKGLFRDGQLDETRSNQILFAIQERADALAGNATEPASDQAATAPPAASPVPEDTEAQWVTEFVASVASAQSAGALDGLRQRIGPAIAQRKIRPDTGGDMAAQVAARRKELQGVDA